MYEYQARLVRIIDGDTVVLEVDMGFHVRTEIHFRLAGIDTPEVRGEERTAGLVAKTALVNMLALKPNCPRFPLRIETTKPDKYGRWLATLFAPQEDGSELNVNQALLDRGFAEPYPG